MVMILLFVLLCVSSSIAQQFCSPSSSIATNYTFPPNAHSPQPYSGLFTCVWTVNVPNGQFLEVNVLGQLSQSDSFILSTDNTDHKRVFSASDEGLNPSGLFRLPPGANRIALKVNGKGSIFFQTSSHQFISGATQLQTVQQNKPGRSISLYNFERVSVSITAQADSNPVVALSLSTYDGNAQDFDSIFIMSGYKCGGPFLATLRDVLVKMPSIVVFSGNITLCPLTPISTTDNVIIAQEQSSMKGLDEYYVYDMRNNTNVVSLKGNNGNKNTAATFFSWSYSYSLHASNVKTNVAIAFTDSTPEKASIDDILPTDKEFYSHADLSASYFTLFFPPHASYSMDVGLTYVMPQCSNETLALSVSNNSYNFPSSTQDTETFYLGTYSCSWKVSVAPGSYARIFVDITLGPSDSLVISHEKGLTRTFSNDSSDGQTFDGIIYLPVGQSEIHFNSFDKGFIQLSVEWYRIAIKNQIGLHVNEGIPLSVKLSDFLDKDLLLTSPNKQQINLALATIDPFSVQALDSCFVYQNGISDATILFPLSDAYLLARTTPNTSYVTCFSPVTIDGFIYAQPQSNVANLASYRVRSLYGSSKFNLDASSGPTALTVVDVDISQNITLKTLSSTTYPLDIIDGTPEKSPKKTTNVVPPEVTTGYTTSYVLKRGSATISVDDGVKTTSSPINQFCSPSTNINIQTSGYSFSDQTTSGSNDCMWIFDVKMNRFAVINMQATIQSGVVLITNLNTGYTRQLYNYLDDNFYFPYGTNVIHLLSESNVTLSFKVSQQPFAQSVYPIYPVFSDRQATVVELDQLGLYGAYIFNTNDIPMTSFTLSKYQTMADRTMLDSVLMFNGKGCQENFISPLGSLVNNPQQYKYQEVTLCPTVAYNFKEVLVVQNAEAISDLTSYSVYSFIHHPTPMDLSIDASMGKSAISFVKDNNEYHLTVSDLKGGILFLINNSPGFDVYSTLSPGVSQPYISLAMDQGIVTIEAKQGTQATFTVGITYVAPGCMPNTNIYSGNGSYLYPYGSPSYPAFYEGTYDCEWDIHVDDKTYAVVYVSAKMGSDDTFTITRNGESQTLTSSDVVQNVTYQQSSGVSTLAFKASHLGSVYFSVKYFENGFSEETTTSRIVTSGSTPKMTKSTGSTITHPISKTTSGTSVTIVPSGSPVTLPTDQTPTSTQASNMTSFCSHYTEVSMNQSIFYTFPQGSSNFTSDGRQTSCYWSLIVPDGYVADLTLSGSLQDTDIASFTQYNFEALFTNNFTKVHYTVLPGNSSINFMYQQDGFFTFNLAYKKSEPKEFHTVTIASNAPVQAINLSDLRTKSYSVSMNAGVDTMSFVAASRNFTDSLFNCIVTQNDGTFMFTLADASVVAKFIKQSVNINCYSSTDDLNGSILVQDSRDFPSNFYSVKYASQLTSIELFSYGMPEMVTLIADDNQNVVITSLKFNGTGIIRYTDGTPEKQTLNNLTSSSPMPFVSTSQYSTYMLTDDSAIITWKTETKASGLYVMASLIGLIVMQYL